MEFLQVPETPAPEPVEPPDAPDCCADEKIGNVFQYTVEDYANFIMAKHYGNLAAILREDIHQHYYYISYIKYHCDICLSYHMPLD